MSNVAFGSRKKTFWSSLEQAPSGKFRDSSPPSKAPRHRPVSGAPSSPGPLRAPPHSRPCSNPPHPEHSYLLSRAPLAVARGRQITICPGVDTHRSPSSALFSKTGGRRGGCVLFGHTASLTRQQQLQRWRVEMCIFEWCGVLIGGLIEPSAGSRRWWNP